MFKKGDKVLCIDDKNGELAIKKGKKYTISSIVKSMDNKTTYINISMKGVDHLFTISRFELIS